jgi:ABC-type phosphate transport system substrate-binding protein
MKRSLLTIGMAIGLLALAAIACAVTDVLDTSAPNNSGAGLPVSGGGTLEVGGSQTATLDTIYEAHDWTFQGTAGQQVTISVEGVGDVDPRVTLIGPGGDRLAADDDGGGNMNALLTYTLPSDGTYTARVDVFTAGEYTITLQ